MSDDVVLFRLAGQACALPASQVRECLPLPRLWRRVDQPAHVAGFFSLGGVVLPVLDLARLLGLRAPDAPTLLEADGLYRHLLRVDAAALLVDRVTGVVRQPSPTPEPSAVPWQNACIAAHLLIEGEPVALLDADRILRHDEQDRLTLLAAQEIARRDGWEPAAPVADAG